MAHLTAGSADGEDILHKAFLAAFDRLAAGKEFEGDPAAWLRATARHMVYAWWRERRRMPQAVAERLERLVDESDDALTAMARSEVRAALRHCLGKLSEADRDLVARRYEQGRRITEIAGQLRRNVSTVRVRLFRIRQALRRCVEARLAEGGAT